MKRCVITAFGLVACLAAVAPPSRAQTTDGYHRIQILPIVVDSASFSARIVFRNPGTQAASIAITFFPAVGTTQGAPLDCGSFTLYPNRQKTFESLRALCPQLASGSQFGFVRASQLGAENVPFSLYSRVSNPQGNGFSVEGFPAHAFTSADSTVTGLRRLAASPGVPAFQSNCFVGLMNNQDPSGPPAPTTVSYLLFNDVNAQIGQGNVQLLPGQMARLLDIFLAAGAQNQNWDNVRVLFTESGEGDPGVMAFCTVQDNTSFGADFRIAKQEFGAPMAGSLGGVAAQDNHVLRETDVGENIPLPNGPGTAVARAFSIPVGATSNTHLVLFRHPDVVACEILDPATDQRASSPYGLELRLLAEDGTTVIAGGNNVTGFADLYLGDKQAKGEGANTRYLLEVESAETNLQSARPYRVHCTSGSGHGRTELLRADGPNLF